MTHDEAQQPVAIDLNAASEDDLAGIECIGPLCAQRIVEYRRLNGRFVSARELRYVEGIADIEALARSLRV